MKGFFYGLFSAIGYLLGVALFVSYFYGTFHAFDRHHWSRGLLSMGFVVPAWYYTAESFWHEEEWEELLEDNSKIFTSLLAIQAQQSSRDADKADLIRQKGYIKKWIQSIPQEQQDSLKSSGEGFINYHYEQQRFLIDQMEKGVAIDIRLLLQTQLATVRNGLPKITNPFVREFMIESLDQVIPDEVLDIASPGLNKLTNKPLTPEKGEMIDFAKSFIDSSESNSLNYLETFFN